MHPVKMIANLAVITPEGALLVRYKDRPDAQSGWFLPHAELAHAEHPEDAARRLVAGGAFAPALKDIASFVGNDQSWHMAFTFATRAAVLPQLAGDGAVLESKVFPLDALPPRRTVAHGGWALDLLAKMSLGTAEGLPL